uniref:Uncharacterized protein n=1 Tax=Avena sativa TaxID=4498 RepID=A0ACD5UP67_AVESA
MASLRVLSVIATAAILFAIADTSVATTTTKAPTTTTTKAPTTTKGPDYIITGRVYCDTCRVGFETNLTQYIKGAKVKLECRHFETNVVDRTIQAETDENGTYNIELKDSHVEDICDIVLVHSPRADCHEIQELRDRAPVLLTRNVGISDNLRLASSLGYLKDVPLPACPGLLKEFELPDDDDTDDDDRQVAMAPITHTH